MSLVLGRGSLRRATASRSLVIALGASENRDGEVESSDVPAPAWPESPGFGLALGGSGFVKSQARPKAESLAWLGLALA